MGGGGDGGSGPGFIQTLGLDVAFIQGLILYSALTYIDSVPKSAIWGTPQKTTFS